MSEEIKPQLVADNEPDHAEQAAVIHAETAEIKAATDAGAKGLIAFCILHPKGAVAILLALCALVMVIGIAFSGYEKSADGTVKKTAVEIPHK